MKTNTRRNIIDDYLAGRLPGHIAEDVRSWLSGDAGEENTLAREWERVVKYEKRPRRFARESFKEIETRLFPGRKSRGWWTRARVAAAVFLPLLAAGVMTRTLLSGETGAVPRQAVVETAASLPRRVILPDKSAVTLNAGSILAHDGGRRVSLEGEAFFRVEKGEEPFVVTVGEVTVTVLGTAFNVEVFPGQSRLKVTVFEGKVEVENNGWRLVTRAGEELFLDPASGERALSRADTTGGCPAWCVSLPVSKFSDILSMIARRYDVRVDNRRPELNDDPYAFLPGEEESLDEVLHLLQVTGDRRFTCTVAGDVVTIE